jgi:hypothetical protein
MSYILDGLTEPPYRMSLIEISPMSFLTRIGLARLRAPSVKVVVTAMHLQVTQRERERENLFRI